MGPAWRHFPGHIAGCFSFGPELWDSGRAWLRGEFMPQQLGPFQEACGFGSDK